MCLSIDALQFNVIICPCPVPFGELSSNIQWNDQHKSTHRHFQAFRAISETIWSRAWSKGCLAVLSNIAKRCCSSRVDLKTNKHIIWNISVSMQFKKGLDKLSNGWTHESLSNEFNWTCFTFEVGFVTAQQLAIMHQCHLRLQLQQFSAKSKHDNNITAIRMPTYLQRHSGVLHKSATRPHANTLMHHKYPNTLSYKETSHSKWWRGNWLHCGSSNILESICLADYLYISTPTYLYNDLAK